MLKMTPREIAIAGCVILVLVLVATVVDASAASRQGTKAQICEVFGPRCPAALRVASCETGGTFYPGAIGDNGNSRGLFQINRAHWHWVNEARLFEPTYNSRIAYKLSRGGRDWSHWTCQP